MRQLNEISARIELESRIRDGARNMLQILEGQQGKGELRSQIQHELDMAEEHMNTLSERRMVLQAKMKESLTSVPYLRPRAIRAVHGLDDLNAPSGERHTPSSSAPLVLPESHVFLMPEVHNIGSLKQDSQPLVKAMALILERWMTGDIRILASEWADVLNTASSLFQMVPQLKNMIDTRVLMLRYVRRAHTVRYMACRRGPLLYGAMPFVYYDIFCLRTFCPICLRTAHLFRCFFRARSRRKNAAALNANRRSN